MNRNILYQRNTAMPNFCSKILLPALFLQIKGSEIQDKFYGSYVLSFDTEKQQVFDFSIYSYLFSYWQLGPDAKMRDVILAIRWKNLPNDHQLKEHSFGKIVHSLNYQSMHQS
jgi:hypothetical protein